MILNHGLSFYDCDYIIVVFYKRPITAKGLICFALQKNTYEIEKMED